MSAPTKVSFKPVGAAAPSSASGGPIIDAETGVPETPAQGANAPDVSAALAPRASQAPAVQDDESYFGGEGDTDAADLRHAWVNLVQPTSKPELKTFGLGHFVLKGDTDLGTSFRCIVVGFSKPTFEEKVKWGSPRGKSFGSVEEVHKFGGTTNWSESVENRKARSDKPFFDTQRRMLLLVEKPESADDARFYKEIDGKLYAPALFFLKSITYGSVFVPLKNEQVSGLLRAGFPTRIVEVSSKKLDNSEAFKAVVRVLEPSSPAQIATAMSLRS
jgi:hypothetical protein